MALKRDWPMTEKQERVFENLWVQVQKVFDFRKPGDQGYRGKDRYREGLRAFCKHLAIHYNSQNFRNVSDKHLLSFIEASREADVNPKTLKTDLSAIRKLHDKTEGTRSKLSDNTTLGYTDKRTTRGVDRAWSDEEVKQAIALTHNMGRADVRWAITMAREFGLRLEETTALTKTQLRGALSKRHLSLRITKGGIPRDVPVTPSGRPVVEQILAEAPKDKEALFLGHGKAHHEVMRSIQNWLYNYRDQFRVEEPVEADERALDGAEVRPKLTMHGLRHAYARDRYQERVSVGMGEKQARLEVATLLGHGRDDVTRVYLGK